MSISDSAPESINVLMPLCRSGSESPAIRHDFTPQSREKDPSLVIVASDMNFVGLLDRLAA